MDGSGHNTPRELEHSSQANVPASIISIEQLQRLVQALDRSDISELELKRPAEGVHLVLRKFKAPEAHNQSGEPRTVAFTAIPKAASTPSPESSSTKHKVLAPLVGTFHVWARPRGGALVAVGDRVKAGQLVGTIESLNVLNEVETSVAGRVIEVHVHDGQPVEYGQVLMTIESAEGAKGA